MANDTTIKHRNKPKIKISIKNRDFLVPEQELQVSTSLPDNSIELSKLNDN